MLSKTEFVMVSLLSGGVRFQVGHDHRKGDPSGCCGAGELTDQEDSHWCRGKRMIWDILRKWHEKDFMAK